MSESSQPPSQMPPSQSLSQTAPSQPLSQMSQCPPPVSTGSAAYVMLQECALQNTIPFKRFDDLEVGKCYAIDKYLLIHGPFGTKMAIRASNTNAMGGYFIINLPDRFKAMANQEKVEELNRDENKGFMYYGGKDIGRKNRIIIYFGKEQMVCEQQQEVNDITGEGQDVPY